MPMSHELHLRCCFCGKEIAEKPRTISVEADDGGVQRLFAHTACLRDRLDPSVPLGAPGAFGVEFKDHKPRWTMRRVIVLGLIWVLVLLIPVAILQFVN
jgi:hypothetical protein